MSSANIRPDDPAFTLRVFHQLLSLYDEVIETVYRARIRDPKKLDEALEDDQWRYHDLPKTLAHAGESITKPQLERLVSWKITHGQHRPFLLSQIRKNAPSTVIDGSKTAFSSLAATLKPHVTKVDDLSNITSDQDAIINSLDSLTKPLTGIGPATASLILSVRFPDHVPFFSDEIFGWLCQEYLDQRGGNRKMRYDVKEYREVCRQVMSLQTRFSSDRETNEEDVGEDAAEQRIGDTRIKVGNVAAVEVEKVAFVLGHLNVLGDGHQGKIVVLGEMLRCGPGDGSEKADENHQRNEVGDVSGIEDEDEIVQRGNERVAGGNDPKQRSENGMKPAQQNSIGKRGLAVSVAKEDKEVKKKKRKKSPSN